MLEILSVKLLHWLQLLLGFTYYYPLYMAYMWMLGAIFFYFRYEFRKQKLPILEEQPRVSIVVPCFNEENNVVEVISHLFALNYDNYEIIAVNDGSSDSTGDILEQLVEQNDKLCVIHHAKNQGKAIALNTAARLSTGEIIIGIDGDALLDADAISWFIQHFQNSAKTGAVTGNPRIRTRSTLLGRLQVGEFSSLVGLIKRAQKTFYGHLFTASGVITAFRKEALQDVEYWSPEMLTEDMDITWKLQLKGWQVDFEPRAKAWILMPETLAGLWNQRLRWAMGGLQIIGKFKSMFKNIRTYSMWPLMCEHLLSIVWACSVSIVFLTYLFDFSVFLIDYFQQFSHTVPLPTSVPGADNSLATMPVEPESAKAQPVSMKESVTALLPEFSGVIIGTTCLLQMLVAVMLDKNYDQQLLRYFLWTIWYPLGFWLINMLTVIVAIPKTLLRRKGIRARWNSPDRGVHEQSPDTNSLISGSVNEGKIMAGFPKKAGADLTANMQKKANPLILDQFHQQSFGYQLLNNCLTALGWGFWIYLWIPIIQSILAMNGWHTPDISTDSLALQKLLETLGSQFSTIVLTVMAFFIWALIRQFNQFRQVNQNFYSLSDDVSNKHITVSSNRLLVVRHEEQTGLIKSVETATVFSDSPAVESGVDSRETLLT